MALKFCPNRTAFKLQDQAISELKIANESADIIADQSATEAARKRAAVKARKHFVAAAFSYLRAAEAVKDCAWPYATLSSDLRAASAKCAVQKDTCYPVRISI